GPAAGGSGGTRTEGGANWVLKLQCRGGARCGSERSGGSCALHRGAWRNIGRCVNGCGRTTKMRVARIGWREIFLRYIEARCREESVLLTHDDVGHLLILAGEASRPHGFCVDEADPRYLVIASSLLLRFVEQARARI